MTSLSGYVKHIRKHVSIFLRCLSQHNILFLAFTYICFVDPPYYIWTHLISTHSKHK